MAVGEPEMRQAEADIWAGKAEWIADQRKMRSAYRVTIRAKKVIVIYDIHLDVIVTLLPNELWVTEFSAPGRRR